MKKTLITGGAGFLGSHLADRLLADGHQVTIVDDLSNGKIDFVPRGIGALYSDFADESTLRFIAQSKFDVVFHLAAKPRVSYSVEHPGETWNENVAKTVRLMEACRGNVGRFVFASSSSVYGQAESYPTAETAAPNPRSPYALQKLQIEQACAMFSDLYSMDTVCVRPFNIYGPRQLPNGAYSTVIPAWLSAIKHDTLLVLHGDGEQTRDFTYVTDVADVFVRAGTYAGKLRGETFNAGAGTRTSLNDIARTLATVYPTQFHDMSRQPQRAGDVKDTWANIAITRKYLGYEPKVSLSDGLTMTNEWAMGSGLF